MFSFPTKRCLNTTTILSERVTLGSNLIAILFLDKFSLPISPCLTNKSLEQQLNARLQARYAPEVAISPAATPYMLRLAYVNYCAGRSLLLTKKRSQSSLNSFRRTAIERIAEATKVQSSDWIGE